MFLEQKGIKTPRLDAELLLANCLKKERIQLYTDYDSPVNAAELTCFRELVRRRVKREPIAYLIGYREFWSLKINVKRGVFIPRPETEVLVEEALKILKPLGGSDNNLRVLELGTGSGAIAVALAKEIRGIAIYATDISLAAADVALSNIKDHALLNSVQLVCGRFLSPFKSKGVFDMVISNPPYVADQAIEGLEPEISSYEPKEALAGGEDGLNFYRLSAHQLPMVLKKQAWVILETGDCQAREIHNIFRKTNKYMNLNIVKDLAGHERVFIAQKK